jgi:hypothetical protein
MKLFGHHLCTISDEHKQLRRNNRRGITL